MRQTSSDRHCISRRGNGDNGNTANGLATCFKLNWTTTIVHLFKGGDCGAELRDREAKLSVLRR